MTRPIFLLIMLMLSWIGLAAVGTAADPAEIRFRIKLEAAGTPHFSLDQRDGRNHFSRDVPWEDLRGLDPAALRQGQGQALSFAYEREAGRLDCTGSGASGTASGSCSFAPDAAFAAFLASRGVGRPSEREALGLTMVGADRALVEGIAAARYPTPSINDLTGLAGLGVTPAYLTELSSRGYRPERISDLMAFKALGVTPAYVDELRRAGFDRLKADEIVQFKALGISPAYLASLRSVGYDRLGAAEIVQLKALGVTSDYIASFQRLGHRMSVDQLVRAKAMNIKPEDLRVLDGKKRVSISAEALIGLKVAGLLP